MKINHSSRFKRSFKKLPQEIQKDFYRKIRIFFNDPFTPSLRTHKLKGNLAEYYAFYLKDGYRVLFDFEGENQHKCEVKLMGLRRDSCCISR